MIPPLLLQVSGISFASSSQGIHRNDAGVNGSSFVLQAPSMERALREILRTSPTPRNTIYYAPRVSSNPALPWDEIPERIWVPGVMGLIHLIRAIDFQAYDVPSNIGQQGCRPPEFQVDGTIQQGPANVCWETQTLANVVARTRMDNGIGEPGIYDFHIHYTNNHLDVSGRSPLAIGPWILNVRGFYFLMGGQPVPNREEYDPMNPPDVPLAGSYTRCRNNEECVASLRYDFEGLVSSVASDDEASSIMGFWNSLGFGRDFYRMTGLPAGTVSMRVYDFMEQIIRPLLSPERRAFLTRSQETWSGNPPLLSWSDMGGLGLRFLMNPGEAQIDTAPNSFYRVNLMSHREVRSLLDSRIGFLRERLGSSTLAIEERNVLQTRLAYFERLRRNYSSQNNINFIQLVSRGLGSLVLNERGEPIIQNGEPRRLDDNRSYLRLSGPAIDLHIRQGEADHASLILLKHVLANEIRVSGPSLNEIFSEQRWNNHIPIRMTLVSPYIQNLSFYREGLRIELPELRADEIMITLPSLADLAEKLHVSREHPFRMEDLIEHWQEWLPYCTLEARNLRVEGEFTIEYNEYHLTLRGNGGVIERVILNTSPHDNTQDAQYANRRIPHLRITQGVIDRAQVLWGALGALRADARASIRDFNVTFPYDHLRVRTPSIELEGTLEYDATPSSPAENMQSPNGETSGFPRPTRVRLSGTGSHGERNSIAFTQVEADFAHRGQNRGRLNLDFDLLAHILPGTIVFPTGFHPGQTHNNMNDGIHLRGGYVHGAHVQSWIHFPYVDGNNSFQHRTLVSGNIRLEFDPPIDYHNRRNTLSVVGQLENVVAESRDACIFFTGSDPNQDPQFGPNYGDAIYVDSRSMTEGGCSIGSIRLPAANQPVREAQSQVPISVRGDVAGIDFFLREIPMLNFMNHHNLHGNFALNLERLVQQGDRSEIDFSGVHLANIVGDVEVAERTLIFRQSNSQSENTIAANRVRVVGHEVQRSLRTSATSADWQLDQFFLFGLNISLRDRSPERNRLTLQTPYIGVYDGRTSFDVNHSFLEILYPGLPRLRMGNPALR